MSTGSVLALSYDYPLVALSALISILASYTALDLTERMRKAGGWLKPVWLTSGVMVLGLGIWTMHYVGMPTFTPLLQVRYDWPTVLLALLAVSAASGVALFAASRASAGLWSAAVGSISMGTGVAAMHYFGIQAMRFAGFAVIAPWTIPIAIALAAGIAFPALLLAFAPELADTPWAPRRLAAALILGMAAPLAHYAWIFGTTFHAVPRLTPDLADAVPISRFGLTTVALVLLVILAHVCTVSRIDRRMMLNERQFLQSQLQLRTVFDNLAEGIAVLDLEGNILLANDTTARVAGCKDAESMQGKLVELTDGFTLDGAPVPLEERPIRMAVKGKYVRGFEIGLRSKGAPTMSFIEVSAAPIPGPDGNPAQIIVNYRDITERKRAEEMKGRLAAIVESSDDAIIALDSHAVVTTWNRGATKLFGYQVEEMIGTSITRLLPAEREGEEDKILERIWLGETMEHFETVRQCRDGRQMDVSLTISPLRNSAGAVVGASKIARDITARKRAEEKARQSEEKFAKAFRSSPIGMAITTVAEGRYVDINQALLKMLGYAESEVVDSTSADLQLWTDPAQRSETMDELRRNGSIRSMESSFRTKSGEVRQGSVSFETIVLDGVDCILATMIDITETKNLEQQFRQSQKMEALGQLTGGIAHDFNNLLGVIVGNLDLLERRSAADAVALKRVQAAQRASVRGAELTRRLLAFSRREQLNPAPVTVEAAINELVELAARTLGPEIKISIQCDANLPQILVDTAALESALLNLAVNARDAMPRGGSLILSAHLTDLNPHHALAQTGELAPGRYVRVAVSDTGHGMSRETLERAFEPFFTTKPRDKGTGLGLAMVYGFIKQSGGAIRLYSEPGFGTTVSLYLPLAGDAQVESEPAAPVKRAEKLGGTALLVDDEADLLDIADAFLAEMGYTVIRAGDGVSALAAVEQAGSIDLMVTDIIMPGKMNGIELARRVRELRPGIKVIYTSGFPAEALAERSGKLEGGPLLHKPYQRAEFADMVRKSVNASPQ